MSGAADSTTLCSLHVGQREGLPVVGGVVAEAADALGLPASERASLRALVQQVLDTIVADSFADGAPIDLDVSVDRRPGGMAVVIADRGAPSSLALGTYPPQIADLIRLGFADDLSVRTEGRQGNVTDIRKDFRYRSLTEDAEFGEAAVDEAAPELGPEGTPLMEVRPMTPDDVFEVARLFFRTYGYSAYQAAIVYEPERLAEYVRAGRHLATVAVTPSGRIIGHVASDVHGEGAVTGRIGLLAVDPAYRRFGVSASIGLTHVVRLIELGFIGQYTEAVTAHDRSQRVALKAGAHEVGLMLAVQQPTLEFQGIETDDELRRSVMLMYGALAPAPRRAVHVPNAYADIVTHIYAVCGLDRHISSRHPRPPEDVPEHTRFQVQLKHEANIAWLTVDEYGKDFDGALQAQLTQLRMNRYDVIDLFLPLGDPRTSFYGNGLQALGLSFSGVYPEYADGDMLVLQSLSNVEVDPATIHTVSEHGELLKQLVLDDFRKAQEASDRLLRSRTRMARLYDALD